MSYKLSGKSIEKRKFLQIAGKTFILLNIKLSQLQSKQERDVVEQKSQRFWHSVSQTIGKRCQFQYCAVSQLFGVGEPGRASTLDIDVCDLLPKFGLDVV